MQFAEHLKEAIAKETKEKTVQDILSHQLAISNANALCQPVLQALKDLTPLDMVKACKDITGTDKLAYALADAQKSMGNNIGNQLAKSYKHLVKEVAKEVTNALTATMHANKLKCFNCGELGHLKPNCPKLWASKPNPPGWCPKCHKGRHWATECRSHFDHQGRPLTPAPARKAPPSPSGNSTLSAAGSAQTQNAYRAETDGSRLLPMIPEGEPSQVGISWGWQLPNQRA
ncbi:hypothetical protein WISP_78092 [Willisornis vidua]|uniref:CCHC-type domain-containing protein n=1 Tax=Willisornis vidua TaxID=1566151 RepID=A0ABQ9D8F2_9PASS|nr:hypothetical protein WISP_78092 [Willisornis vidua]